MGLSSTKLPPLETVPSCVTNRFMGAWFVIAVKPTVFEKTCSNAVEIYTRSYNTNHDINIDFQYNTKEAITSPIKSLPQRGFILGNDKENSGNWNVSPFGCLRLGYPIIEIDDVNYDYVVVGYKSRSFVWIMSRKPVMEDKIYNMLTERLVQKHGYSLDGLRKVPQVWTREERAKRGLESILPDEYLS
jgi:apolipoprotein D and lipocalin family protein